MLTERQCNGEAVVDALLGDHHEPVRRIHRAAARNRDSLRAIHDHMEKSEQQAEEFRKLATQHQMSHRTLDIRVISADGVILAGLLYYLFRISS